MFTGIIQGIAKIISINKKTNLINYIIQLPYYMLDKLEIGASIACNGCCVTVTKIINDNISFDIIKETIKITNLGQLAVGDLINVERSITFGKEIGGHLMSGHIISTAEIIKISVLDNNYQLWLKINNILLQKYIFYKGYIGLDGISLTISEVTDSYFSVHIIPETLKRTTIKYKNIGNFVNIEIDSYTQIIVDTVERFLKLKKQ